MYNSPKIRTKKSALQFISNNVVSILDNIIISYR